MSVNVDIEEQRHTGMTLEGKAWSEANQMLLIMAISVEC
jgi:hypothetical protein